MSLISKYHVKIVIGLSQRFKITCHTKKSHCSWWVKWKKKIKRGKCNCKRRLTKKEKIEKYVAICSVCFIDSVTSLNIETSSTTKVIQYSANIRVALALFYIGDSGFHLSRVSSFLGFMDGQNFERTIRRHSPFINEVIISTVSYILDIAFDKEVSKNRLNYILQKNTFSSYLYLKRLELLSHTIWVAKNVLPVVFVMLSLDTAFLDAEQAKCCCLDWRNNNMQFVDETTSLNYPKATYI